MSRWIYGKHAVLERLRLADHGLEQVCLAKGLKPKDADEIQRAAQKAGVRVEWRDRAWLDERAEGRHQGVAAVSQDFKYTDLGSLLDLLMGQDQAVVVALDGIEDPHNLGAILRSCECAGVAGVIIPKDRAVQVTPTVEKVSAGAATLLPVCSVTNLNRALEELKEAGFWSYGLAGEAEEGLYEQRFDGKVCLVFGAEGEGMRDLVARNCDKLVRIPMQGQISSLNVSVSVGVTLFEVLRQKNAKKSD